MRKTGYIMLFLVLGSFSLQAQEELPAFEDIQEDDLGNVTDEFQEFFFEALKQKGIENYEKALEALEKCQGLMPESAVVLFEMGRNLVALGDLEKAEIRFREARELDPEKESIHQELLYVYREQENFEQAIVTLMDLMPYDPRYKEDLANIYLLDQQYENALHTLEELDQELGKSSYRERMRRQIYARTGNTQAQIGNLREHISDDPENEQHYLNLIYIYSEQGDQEEAFKTALELLEVNPGSRLVHLALYKFYLERGEPELSVRSMKIVFESEEIDPESKFKVLHDFLGFVNEHPAYQKDLMEVSGVLIEWEEAPELYGTLGRYYLEQGQDEEALEFFKSGLKTEPGNFELLKSTLLIQLEMEQHHAALDLSTEALEIFPAQPLFYLLHGIALNYLGQYPDAIEILGSGLDFLIDDPRMEADFYHQLGIGYAGLRQKAQAEEFKRKAAKLLKDLK